eukprot:4831584-Amphidinium_carterae.1
MMPLLSGQKDSDIRCVFVINTNSFVMTRCSLCQAPCVVTSSARPHSDTACARAGGGGCLTDDATAVAHASASSAHTEDLLLVVV